MSLLRRLIPALLIAVATALLTLAWTAVPWLNLPIRRLNETLYDTAYQYRRVEPQRDAEVVIVAIDNKALAAIDELYQKGWPWPRKYYGVMADYLLNDCGARAVVFDMLFEQRAVNRDKPEEDDDAVFAASIDQLRAAGKPPVVFGTQAFPGGKHTPFFPPVNTPVVLGAVNVSESEKWRTYSPVVNGVPSLALQALNVCKIPPRLPTDDRIALHFYGPHFDDPAKQIFRTVNAAAPILCAFGEDEAKVGLDKTFFRDKIVLVGAYAAGTYDVKSTPLDPQTPGVDIHATAILNLIRGDAVWRVGWLVTALATLAASLLASVGVTLPRWWLLKLACAFAALLLVGAVGIGLFVRHTIYWLPMAPPLIAGLIATIAAFAWVFFGEDRQRRRLMKALSSVVSPAVAEELARDPKKLHIGGERREMTVMFTDIAGFTDLSETLPPERLAPMLNYYLEEMSGIVLSESGTLDKYIGDAIMSFWNAPLPQADHAALACRAALGIVKREADIQQELKTLGAARILTRVGINSGPMAVGFTGSSHLINYTVLGDSVNLGSRLEGANKLYGTRIMLAESTANLVRGRFVLRQLDVLRVKGKQQPMPVFELMAEGMPDEPTARRVELYESALRHYQRQQWTEAEASLVELLSRWPDDGPAKTLMKRIEQFRREPPPIAWDGVYVAKDK